MDRLDAAILRAMLRTGEWSPVGIDPRLSPAELARRIGGSTATVRRRLTEWRRGGFCREVVPVANPSLFGLVAQFQVIELEDRAHCAEFEEEIAVLEGPTLGFRFGVVYAVISIYPERRGLDRDQSRLARLKYARRVIPPTPVPLPVPERPLREADLRHYRRLRENPTGPGVALASRLGESSRSGHRRLTSWIERNQVFFLPSLDFSRARGTVAWLGAILRPGVDRERFLEHLGAMFPDRIPVQEMFPLQRITPDLGAAPPLESLQFLLPAGTAHLAEGEFARLGAMPEVARSILNFPTRSFALRSAFDDHLGVGQVLLTSIERGLAAFSVPSAVRPQLYGLSGMDPLRPVPASAGLARVPAMPRGSGRVS